MELKSLREIIAPVTDDEVALSTEAKFKTTDATAGSSKKAKQLIGWSPARSDLDNIIKTSWAKYSYNMKVNKL